MDFLQISKSYYSPGLLEEACEENLRKLELDPNNHIARYSLALALAQLGKYDESLKHYDILINQNPTPEYWNNYGKTLYSAGKYEKAIEAFNNVINSNCKWPDTYCYLARCYKAIGEITYAETYLKLAISLHPRYKEALNELGEVLELQGRIDEAIKEYKKVIALFFAEYQTNDIEAFSYDISVLLDNPELVEELIKQLKKLLERYPGYADAYYKLGQALEAKGLHTEAKLAYRKALEINPRYETARKMFWKK